MLNFHRILISLNVTEGAGAIWADSCILDAHQEQSGPLGPNKQLIGVGPVPGSCSFKARGTLDPLK